MSSRFLVAVLVSGTLIVPGSASASESRSLDNVSTGGNGVPAASYRGQSADGTRVFFTTTEALVSADTDASSDIYERSAGTTTLISTGPTGGNGAFNAVFNAVSDDGSKVLFRTAEKLVGTDTDASQDLYMRSAGTTTLISTGPAGGNGANSAFFDAMSADGSRVTFDTLEKLVGSDGDASFDIYQRSGSTTTLISTGPSGGNDESDAMYEGSSLDGTRVFFSTDETMTNTDTDLAFDIYQRVGSVTTHLSIGPVGGNGDPDTDYDSFYEGASPDGTVVWFSTDEALTADDLDSSDDLYQATGGTTTRVSQGPSGGNAEIVPFFGGSSDDGSRVFFDTAESLVPEDTDTSIDVYERSGGQTTLVSTGPNGGNATLSSAFQAASPDGSRVIFQTSESLVPEDTDTMQDVYERLSGQTTLLSTGPSGGNAVFPASFNGASRDASRVYFTTYEALDPADTDGNADIYQRYAGDTTWISTGPSGGNGAYFTTYKDTNADGTRVFFETAEALTATDTDSSQDVYSSSTSALYARPKGASPFRVSLVPAFQACSSPNSSHGAPFSFGSCKPPTQTSSFLTIGAPDANGQAANSTGLLKYVAVLGNANTPADEADVKIIVSVTDVRKKSDLSDYTGQLQVLQGMNITDRYNGSAPVDAATTSDFNFAATVPCASTADTSVGSTCSVSTTADAVMPGAIVEIKRMVLALGQGKVFDGGSDGVASTAPNTLFLVQGLSVP